MMVAVHGRDRPDRDARRLHVDQQEGDALLRPLLGAGAHQAEDPVGPLHVGRPDLLAGHDIVVTLAHGPRAQAGQVRAGTRLRIALRPPDVAAADARQEAGLLGLACVGVDDRADVVDAEGDQPRRTGLGGLLLEDEALQRGPLAAAEFPWPVADGPTVCVQHLQVPHVVVLFQLQVVKDLVLDVGRQLPGAEAPHFHAEAMRRGKLIIHLAQLG